MVRRLPTPALPALLAVLALSSGACSGSGGSGGTTPPGTGQMSIVSCSLGCTTANSEGTQFSCGVTDIFVNQEIRLTFSQPVDLGTVTNNSFRLVEASNPQGRTPPGSFRLDPGDPRILVYRPQLTFNSEGNPIFGLNEGSTYILKIAGTALDSSGPFIRSRGGDANRTRLECTLRASRGIFDAQAGAPQAEVLVDVVVESDPATGEPTEIAEDVPASGKTGVWRNSDITIIFDDVMNPATVANPVTKESDTISVFVDPDGNPADDSDQLELRGTYTLTIDQERLTTTVNFEPLGGLPSAGINPPRRVIVVELAPTIFDLGGNPLKNPGDVVFTPEVVVFQPMEITETFTGSTKEDSLRGGGQWGGGELTPGLGGGSGRLGDLFVPQGVTVTLRTDSEDFSASEFLDPRVFNRQTVIDLEDPAAFSVDGGVFEFSRLVVETGGTLRLEGSNPARLYVRGEGLLQGTISASGRDALVQDPADFEGGIAPVPGPSGGRGGDGGDRPDGENFVTSGGLDNPLDPGPAPSEVLDPSAYVNVNGGDGVGIPVPDFLDPTTRVAGGEGGLAWPQPGAAPPPFDTIHFPADPSDTDAFPFEPTAACQIIVPGAAGGGAAYSFDGKDGRTEFIDVRPPVPPPLPPQADGGETEAIGLTAEIRTLDPAQGWLRGGAGGGGGGAHLTATSVNGLIGFDCTMAVGGEELEIDDYLAHSSAAGGSGGGALQIQSGRRTRLNGVIDVSGGDGGGATFPELAQAGGAGSGGALLLQGPLLEIQAVPGRMDVSGGIGGAGPFDSRGGDGGPGLVRLEAIPAPVLRDQETKLFPTQSDLEEQYGSSAMIEDVFSVDEWMPHDFGPDAQSGAQSCWFQLPGNFFQLEFEGDVEDELGWDMLLCLAGLADPQSYRGENDVTGPGGASLQEMWGNELGSAPLIVRFQGARAFGQLAQPCNVQLSGLQSPLIPGSLTSWVEHPEELTTFHADPSLSPNIYRFTIIWNREHPASADIQSVKELSVNVTPD